MELSFLQNGNSALTKQSLGKVNMGIQTTQQALKVYLSNISPHSQAILEFFIGSSGGSFFKLVPSSADAQVYITDFDFPGSKEHWKKEHQTSKKPCIALSMQNPENPHVEWVEKPLTAKALIAAAVNISKILTEKESDQLVIKPSLVQSHSKNQVQQKNSKAPPPLPHLKSGQSPLRQKTKTSVPSIRSKAPMFQQSRNNPSIIKEKTNLQKEKKVPKHIGSNTTKIIDNKPKKIINSVRNNQQETSIQRPQIRIHPLQERWDLLCGDYKNISFESFKSAEQYHYNCESYFQGTLIAGLRLAKQTQQVVQIKYAPHQFYICFDGYLIFSPLAPDTDEYARLCHSKVKPGQVNLHILTSPESTALKKRINRDVAFTYDLESFIWTSCLLTSKGRMPSLADLDTRYLLKYWPNFTRIENFPFAMKLAAQWQKKPYTIIEIANKMDIPQRYIIAFVNGIIGLSLFEPDESIIQKKNNQKVNKKNGFIVRLFGRLTQKEGSFK